MTQRTKARLVTATTLGDAHAERIDYADLPPGLTRIGASFTFGGQTPSEPGVPNTLAFEAIAPNYLAGITVDTELHKLVFPTTGRYLLAIGMVVAVDATHPRLWALSDDLTPAIIAQIVLSDALMGGFNTTSNVPIWLSAHDVIEISAGTALQWAWTWSDLGAGESDTTTPQAIEVRVQYLGPATSI